MFETIHRIHGLGVAAGALSSLFWTITYALVLRQGARDRVPGMPLVALGANLAWEIIFLGVTIGAGVRDVRLAMLLPWALLDIGIVIQSYRYGARDARHPLVARHFALVLTAILLGSLAVLLAFVAELRDAIGWYSAFGQNLMMSALFVAMLLRRDSARGQSVAIAASKLLGTFFAFLLALFWSPPSLHHHWTSLLPDRYTPVSPLIVVLYTGIFILDVLYLVLLHRKAREQRRALCPIDLWR